MLHILFVILKVIGILLLAILGIILFLVFSSLLIPFSYQIKGEKTEETWNARIRLSWLFYAVYLVKEFGGENSRFECYLLGIPMLRLNTWLNHKRAGKRTKTGTKNKETFEMDSVKSVEPKADSETAKAKTLQNTEGSEKKRDSEEKNSTERALNSKTADDKNFKNKNIVDTENVSEEKIEAACKAVGLDHFIRTLPHGYDTILNDQVSLSQGQKQQLTIARAMIADKPMLILDEATSSVDTRTELQIQKAMDALMQNRTSFVIAHRLSTIKNADLILVLKDGDIIESGNHEELLAKGGFYADLYNSQFDQAS